jgi:hypothetical protein
MKRHVLSLVSFLAASAVHAQVDSVWVRGYPGTQLYGGDITGDGSGNVYVTGQAFDNAGDYLTLKYNTAGVLLWARTYDGPGNGYDQPHAIAVDQVGNVFVTGTSNGGAATDADYCTIKYSPIGDLLWVRRHNGYPASPASVDVATALVADNLGNAYVTGYGAGPANAVDVFTIKYAPNGDSLWGQYYNFSATNGGDRGWAITIDAANNVIIAGESWGGTQIPPATGLDYLVLRYSSGGALLLAKRQPASAGSADDVAQAVATDNAGNIYATGFAQAGAWYVATFRFSPTGDNLWQQNYAPPGLQGKKIAVAGGSLYVAGATYDPSNFLTLKYTTAGTLQWARQYDNGGSDQMMDMGVDVNGNVYVTGASQGAFNGDYATIKYSAAGDSQWVQRYASPLGYDDIARGIHVFSPGELAVTGSSAGQIVTVRYSESTISGLENNETPGAFSLGQNYPNPFNPTTTIRYALPVDARVTLEVYDMLGRRVAQLVDGQTSAGYHDVGFDASNLASGMYLYRVNVHGSDGKNFSQVKKLMLLK